MRADGARCSSLDRQRERCSRPWARLGKRTTSKTDFKTPCLRSRVLGGHVHARGWGVARTAAGLKDGHRASPRRSSLTRSRLRSSVACSRCDVLTQGGALGDKPRTCDANHQAVKGFLESQRMVLPNPLSSGDTVYAKCTSMMVNRTSPTEYFFHQNVSIIHRSNSCSLLLGAACVVQTWSFIRGLGSTYTLLLGCFFQANVGLMKLLIYHSKLKRNPKNFISSLWFECYSDDATILGKELHRRFSSNTKRCLEQFLCSRV